MRGKAHANQAAMGSSLAAAGISSRESQEIKPQGTGRAMQGQPGKVCGVRFTVKTRPRDFGNCREQSCNPTPMPSRDNCSIWTPFLPSLPGCGFLHREERTGSTPCPMRGEVMPPSPLPFLGSARFPEKCLAPLFAGLPCGPQAPPGLWRISTRLLEQPTPASMCAILFRNSGTLRRGGKAPRLSKGAGHCHAEGPNATLPSGQFIHSFTELVHQSISKPSGDPEKGNTESLPIRNVCSREGDKHRGDDSSWLCERTRGLLTPIAAPAAPRKQGLGLPASCSDTRGWGLWEASEQRLPKDSLESHLPSAWES